MIGIGAQILPGVERTLQTDIEIRIGGVGDIDTHLLAAEAGDPVQQTEQTVTDGTGVLQFGMAFGFVLQPKKYYMLYHNSNKIEKNNKNNSDN